MDAITAAIVGGFITIVGLGLLLALAAICAIWAIWFVVRRWGPRSVRGPITGFPLWSVGIPVLVIAFPAGCAWLSTIPQPASLQTVATVEVPLRTPADHAAFMTTLRRIARDNGLHVDDGTEQWIAFRRGAPSDEPPDVRDILTKSIDVGVFRGSNDDDPEINVDDGGHQGRAWLMFSRGKHPELAAKARVQLVAEIKRRWPDARDVPVLPGGSLPFAKDLIWTGKSYVVKPERLADYTGKGG